MIGRIVPPIAICIVTHSDDGMLVSLMSVE